jgi:hypothetical protein
MYHARTAGQYSASKRHARTIANTLMHATCRCESTSFDVYFAIYLPFVVTLSMIHLSQWMKMEVILLF